MAVLSRTKMIGPPSIGRNHRRGPGGERPRAVTARRTNRLRKTATVAGRVVVLASLWIWLASGALAQETPLERAVKATYLYKLAPFVTWPAAALGPPSGPFSICVVGDDPFGALLDSAVAGQQVGGRPIVIRRTPTADRSLACQIMYLGGPRERTDAMLRAMHGAPVLTVTDGSSAPGIVDFTIEQGRVRFRVDDEAAAENGLVMSSKLLGLAVSVNPRKALGKSQ